MAWNEVTPMEEINRYVSLAVSGRFTHTQLCADFHISRKTGYKWLRRYQTAGRLGLQPRSHRTQRCPHRTAPQVVQQLLAWRRRYQTWGPKKLYALLLEQRRRVPPPACSTIAAILRRHGLITPRRRRPGLYPVPPAKLTKPTHPNHVWTVDFKGWFLLGNAQRCDPLTVCDGFSHYVIGCRAQPNQQFKGTLRAFKKLMRHHGLPQIIRVDNGAPFASIGLGRLSQLSVWWINQGIAVEFTRPGHPQDNGSHERMHKDLKAECTQPPSPTFAAQQRRLERWQHLRNHVRPHEALQMQKPAQIYHRSRRRLSEHVKAPRYPKTHQVRTVSASGHVWHQGHNYHVGEALAGCKVGLFGNATGTTELHFANVHLGNLLYDPEEQHRPKAYVVPPNYKPLVIPYLKPKSKV